MRKSSLSLGRYTRLGQKPRNWLLVSIICVVFSCLSRCYAELPEFTGIRTVGYSMQRTPSVRVRAELSREVHLPDMAVESYSMTVAVPPEHSGQEVVSFASEKDFQRIADVSSAGRPLAQQFERLNRSASPSTLSGKFVMTLQLYDRRLQRSRKALRKTARAASLNLDDSLRQRYLELDAILAYESPGFREWKKAERLFVRSHQSELDFARLVFDRIRSTYRYNFEIDQIRSATALCQANSTDDAGLSILFATLLRSEGIPTRTLVGHYAQSLSQEVAGTEEPSGTRHVIAEFFVRGVGWVPVDLAAAILSPTQKLAQEHFGTQVRPFITLHYGHQVRFATGVWGEKTEDNLQFPRLWFKGIGEFDNLIVKDNWTVEPLSQHSVAATDKKQNPVSLQRPVYVPVPHIRQGKKLCACASASMALRRYGVNLDQAKIKSLANQALMQRDPSQVNFPGTYFVDLVSGLRNSGVADWHFEEFTNDEEGFKKGLQKIHENLSRGFPVIVDLHIPPEGHTVVVNGIDAKRGLVLVVDPNINAPGVRRLTIEQFKTMWRSVTVDTRGLILTGNPNN